MYFSQIQKVNGMSTKLNWAFGPTLWDRSMHQSYLTEDRHQNEKQKKGKVLTNLKRQKSDRTFRILHHDVAIYFVGHLIGYEN